MTAAKTDSVFKKVSEIVTRVQKGESRPTVVISPKSGSHHYTVRVQTGIPQRVTPARAVR